MRRQVNELPYKCLSDDYTLDSLRAIFTGNDSYLIRAVISGRWTLSTKITKSEYNQYRDMSYTDPAKAKNYLLDLLPWDGYPFTRDTFRFVNTGDPLSEEALIGLTGFVSML